MADLKFWLCMPSDIESTDEVEIVYDTDIESVLDHLAYQSIDGALKDYVNDFAINMSFAEKFYHDDNGEYLFDMRDPGLPREDIMEKFDGDEIKAFQYIDDVFEENVEKFFSKNPYLGWVYLQMWRGEMVDVPELLYFYVCRYGEWIHWNIREIECPNCEDEVMVV